MQDWLTSRRFTPHLICGVYLNEVSLSIWPVTHQPIIIENTQTPPWNITLLQVPSASSLFSSAVHSPIRVRPSRRPVFVQLLLIVFRLSQCAWLSASQRHNVESCVRTSSDMACSRSITIPSDLGNKVGSKVTQLNPRRDGRIRSVILRSPTGNCSNYAVKTLYPLETQISLRVKKKREFKKRRKMNSSASVFIRKVNRKILSSTQPGR